MCNMLYIGADQELPLIPWDERAPAFHVEPLSEGVEAVRNVFGVPYVYYAGSHDKCGCGFQLGEFPDPEDEEAPAMRRSLNLLADYVEQQLARVCRLSFYACWAGGESAEPVRRRSVTAEQLRGEDFFFLEKESSRFEAT